MENILGGLLIFISVFAFIGSVIFFMLQLSKGRSPYAVFFGVLTKLEFKILLSMIENSELKTTRSDHWTLEYTVNSSYTIKHNDSDKEYWSVNGVKLSYFQEKALIKSIKRSKLKVRNLTKAGQVLYQ